MEVLKDKITIFLNVDSDYGNRHGKGTGTGAGGGHCLGSGCGSSCGSGWSSGNGYDGGYGCGVGSNFGSGYGSGYGNDKGGGVGNGYDNGDGLKSIDGYTLYNIDEIPTAITSLHGNYAKGFTLKGNVIKVPCYIVRVGNYFAHGETLKAAMKDVYAKYEQNRPLSERIADFKETYPTLDTEAEASNLFRWHNILTGSCLLGRKQFCEQHGVDYKSGKWKIRDFFELCKDAYGSKEIKQTIDAYK